MDQDIYIFCNSIYLTTKFLEKNNVPSQTIYNNTSAGKENKLRWYTCKHPNNKKEILIAYDSLPNYLIEKYKLPSYEELKSLYNQCIQKRKTEIVVKRGKHIKDCLDAEYSCWQNIQEIYRNKFLDGEKLEMFCKTHAVLSKIIELNELNKATYSLAELFVFYSQYTDLIFLTDNYRSFCNKIRKIKKAYFIEDELLHGLMNLPSNNLKMTEDVIIEIKRNFLDPRKLNAGQILENVNSYLVKLNRDPISISAVYSIISMPQVQNEAMIFRHGKKYANEHILPHAHFDPPKYEGILWVMDGSRFQFAYKNEFGKIKFIRLFVVLDGKSREILGYSIDNSENSTMVFFAMEGACRKTNYLPSEIISDNSPAYKSCELEKIQAIAKIWGCYWRKIKFSNPQDNSYVERFFGVLQETCCKKYEGYLGDGMKSKNLNGKPSPEEIKKYMQKKNLKNKNQLIKLVHEIVYEYNNLKKIIALKNNVNHLLFNDSSRKFIPIELNSIKYSILFWRETKVVYDKGMITFDYQRVTYKYNIYDRKIAFEYRGTQVMVRFNPLDLSFVLIFDVKNDDYIAKLDRYNNNPKALVERSSKDQEEVKAHIAKKRKLKADLLKTGEAIIEASNRNRDMLPPELTELGVGSKREREESEDFMISNEFEENSKFGARKIQQKEKQFDDLFEGLFFSEGDLSILEHGKN